MHLSDHPGLERFYTVLSDIRKRAEVQDVLVTIYEIEEGDKTRWPFSERLYVLTKASPDELLSWAAELQPSEVLDDGFVGGKPAAAPDPKPGFKVLSLWWD